MWDHLCLKTHDWERSFPASGQTLSAARTDDMIVYCTARRAHAALVEFVRAFGAGDYRPEASVSAWARILRDNTKHERTAPPRRLQAS